jgi:hypothetical protein
LTCVFVFAVCRQARGRDGVRHDPAARCYRQREGAARARWRCRLVGSPRVRARACRGPAQALIDLILRERAAVAGLKRAIDARGLAQARPRRARARMCVCMCVVVCAHACVHVCACGMRVRLSLRPVRAFPHHVRGRRSWRRCASRPSSSSRRARSACGGDACCLPACLPVGCCCPHGVTRARTRAAQVRVCLEAEAAH